MKNLVSLLLIFWTGIHLIQAQVPQGLKEKEDKDKFQLQEISLKSPFTLDHEFHFNKKFYFTAKTSEVQVNSYFYLNTKNGLFGIDKDLAEQLKQLKGSDLFNEMDFAIELETGEFFTYTTRQRTADKIAMITYEMLSYLPDYLEGISEPEFFKDYMERDGNKTYVGDKSQFPSESFQGVNLEASGHMLAWFSKNTDFQMNPENRKLILSPFGIGYVFFENQTYLITGWESDDYVSRLEKIEDVNFTFKGKEYTPLQEKIEVKIVESEEKMDAARAKEQDALARQEADARQRLAAASPEGNSVRRAQIDVEIVEIKKQILEKRKILEEKTISKAKEISKKQGSLESAKKSVEEMFEGNEFVEIQKLELKESILKDEKALLGNSLDSKERDAKQKSIDCQKRLLVIFEGIYDKFTEIDRQYGADLQQVFLKKMNVYNQELTPIMANPCGN
ncbi:cell envelope integrity protein TolA [Algoriphagus litoralis]|uniref:cell envelope integrity protein TolA n=1 Tax=Algoriphagus litoralis TaxID=2202829 RepID=UPI000DB9FBBF|nr:cell envelope integrity protein TolA [Algoriphagus litoralis]